MSHSSQPTFYKRDPPSHSQSHPSSSLPASSLQTIESLKSQLAHKDSLITQLSARLQQQECLLQEKDFIIKQRQLELEYIHKQNEELHEKIFQLNQRLNAERADLKQTIKQEVGMLKEEFNFMIKENQTKTEIILQQKQHEFQRKEQDLKAIINELSQRGSNNGSFYYEESHSSIAKTKNIGPFSNTHDFDANQEEKPSTANSILKNSRESYKSHLPHKNKVLTSLRESIVGETHKTLKDRETGSASVSNLIHLKEGGTEQSESQVTGRFGFIKTPITSKYSVRRGTDDIKQTSSRASSRPNIEEIISRSKRELNQRNKKSSMSELPKAFPASNTSSNSRLVRKRMEDLQDSKSSIRYGMEHLDEKRKSQKLKQISSLKMKVNMLKTQLKEEISFCQHKE